MEAVDAYIIRLWDESEKINEFLFGYKNNELLCQDNGFVRRHGGRKISKDMFIIPAEHFEAVKSELEEEKIAYSIVSKIMCEKSCRYIVSFARESVYLLPAFAKIVNRPLEILVHPEDEELPVINKKLYDKPSRFSLKCENVVSANYCTNYSYGGWDAMRIALNFIEKYNIDYDIKISDEKLTKEDKMPFYELSLYIIRKFPDEEFTPYLKKFVNKFLF